MTWPMVKIESIRANSRNSLVGGPFGSDLTTRDYVEDGVPVIRGANLPEDVPFNDDDFVFVSEEKAGRLASNTAVPGDVVFTQRGTLGQVGLIPEESRFPKYVISQSQMKLTVNPKRADSKFVYYFFRHPNTVQTIKNHGLTSGVPHINLGVLRALEMPLPPIVTQGRIVAALSHYDDLIRNNCRRMALLEESARQLYREWFVRLRFPGHEHTPIRDGLPKRWEKRSLGEVATLNYGKALNGDDRREGSVPVYGSSGVVGVHSGALVNGPGIVVGRKGNVGSVYWTGQAFWPIDTVYFVSPEESDLYLYFCLKNLSFQSSDVAVPGLNRTYAQSLKMLVPPSTIRVLFVDFVAPLFSQMATLTAMSGKLRAARDLLLPPLMSGEISV